MPQDIVSQFDRKYNAPIETNRAVATINDRNNIPSNVRWEGMLVYVESDDNTYILKGGVLNGDWKIFDNFEDAPQDGKTYGRNNGAWTEIVAGGGRQMLAAVGVDTANLAGVYSNLMFYDIPANSLVVGDVFEIYGFVVTLSDADDQVNYRLGSNVNGIVNPNSGNHIFRAVTYINTIGASGAARTTVTLLTDNGDFISQNVFDDVIDTTANLLYALNGGGTSVNSVTLKNGYILKSSL